MSFTTFSFGAFFAAVFCVYWALPQRLRKWAALAASAAFYAPFGAKSLAVLALCAAASWGMGFAVAARRDSRARFAACIALSLVPLALVKYAPGMFGVVGVSFFTFKIIAYLAQVRAGEIEPERDFAAYALYVSFFPEITSGPIQRASSLLPQIHAPRAFDAAKALACGQLIVWGMFKKLMIADNLAGYVQKAYDQPDLYIGPSVLLAMVLYSVQLYCDFSGYSEMAVGMAGLLGFDVEDNFRMPYFARSIREFWAKWHISLSTFLRDYVYFPLGGSRCGTWRTAFNLMATFLVSGIWHGTGLTFLVWGLLHGAYQVAGRLTRTARSRAWSALHIREDGALASCVKALVTFALVTFAWIFFGAPSLERAFDVLRQIPSGFTLSVQTAKNAAAMLGFNAHTTLRMGLAMALMFGVEFLARREGVAAWLAKRPAAFRYALCWGLCLAVLFWGAASGGSFIYFEF